MSSLRRHHLYHSLTRLLLLLFLGLLVWGLVSLWPKYRYGSPGTKDFVEYWAAGQLLLHGVNPYDEAALAECETGAGVAPGDRVLMWNPPWLLVWMLPLVALPFEAAAVSWFGISLLLILASAVLVWRALAPPSWPGGRLMMGWVATLAFVPVLFTLQMGQVSSLLVIGLAGFLYALARGWDALAGACLALTTIKPHVAYLVWIVLACWVLYERRWKVVAGMAALLAPTFAILTWFWPGWVAGYRAALAHPPVYWQTPTLGTLLRLTVGNHPALQFLPTLVVGLTLAAFCLIRRPDVHWKTWTGPLLLLSVPTAAYGWTFDQAILLLPYLQIVIWLLNWPSRLRLIVGVVPLLLIAILMAVQNRLGIPMQFFFWVPLALGAVYLAVWWCSPTASAFSAKEPCDWSAEHQNAAQKRVVRT